uniref:Retinol dehydrogenase 14 n=1 Tax=Timema tahoe TaxID=61484 RepID=A0A7R9FEE5_9NEOP|nr:unnamed protein product [Timema tahoe]
MAQGHKILSKSGAGLLKKSAPSRIVTVSSVLHRISNLRVDNLNGEKSFNWMTVYANSKLANLLTSNHLAKILEGTGVTSNCLHPGVIVTGIWRHVPSGLRQVLLFFLRMVLKDAVEGAQTTLYLAVSEQMEGVTGKYFAECKFTSIVLCSNCVVLDRFNRVFSQGHTVQHGRHTALSVWIEIGRPMVDHVSFILVRPLPASANRTFTKEVTPSAKAREEGFARKLWEKSEEIVKLKPQERVL